MAKIIAICGKICSGKSYYAHRIREKENAVILSTDEVTFDLIENKQGEFYDDFTKRVNFYLRKKAAEIALVGCNVILDWGFWTHSERSSLTKYYADLGLSVEWHYIDVKADKWEEQINERNMRIVEGEGGSDFFVDSELKKKVISLFEEPAPSEIDVWYYNE